MNIIGDVKGRRCILFDDIVDSAGTLCNAAQALVEAGAASVSAYVTHGVLSGGAVERVAGSALTELVITDSIEATDAVAACVKIRAGDLRQPDRRGDPADRQRGVGFQAVRLTRAPAPPAALSRGATHACGLHARRRHWANRPS